MAFNLNRAKLQGEARKANAKRVSGNTIPDVFDAFKLKVWNVIDYIGNLDSYTMANWILFKDRWIHNQSYENTQKYSRGSIVMADLGASNFKSEPSYEHPCVVLSNRKNKILVVPCSSGAYGKGYSDVIDSPANTQGFRKDTGVQIGHFRWIHKNRILYKMSGKASADLLDLIDDFMLNLIPTFTKRDSIMKKVLLDNSQKEKEITSLKSTISLNDQLFEQLEQSYNEIEHKYEQLQQWVIERYGSLEGFEAKTIPAKKTS